MLHELTRLPEGFLTVSARDLHRVVPVPTLIHLGGIEPRPLFVSMLLHGNEDVGLRALQQVLARREGRPLPRALSLFVGNVDAARAGVRRLDHQPDFNRIWGAGAPVGEMQRLAQRVISAMRRRGVWKALDLHNNTGRNPLYSCIHDVGEAHLELARRFSPRALLIHSQASLGAAFTPLCPTITCECGEPGNAQGIAQAAALVDGCLDEVPDDAAARTPLDLFEAFAVLKVAPHSRLGGTHESPAAQGADVLLPPDIEALNFRALQAGQVIATTSSDEASEPLQAFRLSGEVLAGIVLGPTVVGAVWPDLESALFPSDIIPYIGVVAQLGLIFYMFLVGLEVDLSQLRGRIGQVAAISNVSVALPMVLGLIVALTIYELVGPDKKFIAFALFMGVSMSITAFPVLARILAEIKLLGTDLGRIAMSAAIVNDMCAWILLAIAIAISEADSAALSSLWVLLSGVLFVLFCFYAVRPGMWWLIRRTPEGEGVSDMQVSLILTGVMLAGVCTDAIGIHSVFGAFVYGLVIPTGPLGVVLIEKIEDFVTGLLLPLFFAISGLRTNVQKINDPITVGLLVLVFVMASFAKIMGTIIIAALYTMPFREGIALGFLMNTRGLVEMIVLNIGRDKEVDL